MASKRRERSLSRSSHYKNKPVNSLLEDRINKIKLTRHRIADTEDDEDDVETGGGPTADDNDNTSEKVEEAPPPPPPPPPPDPNKYAPVPYVFRIPVGPQTKEVRRGYAKCPPFYLQLDHTLAVIWCLFSKQPPTKPLGIAQLQWALNFLRSIKNQNGEQPKDISLCIQAIEDQLLDTYAALVNEITEDENDAVDDETNRTAGKKGCNPTNCEKIGGEFAAASGSAQNMQQASDIESAEKLIAQRAKDVQSDVIITNLPFSVNYTEMMKSSPFAGDRRFKTQLGNKSLTDAQIQQEIEQLKIATAATMPDAKLGETRSRDDMLKFLNLWRKEQLEKVQAELKRLHSIENFIENVDHPGPPVTNNKKPVKRVSIKEPEAATE